MPCKNLLLFLLLQLVLLSTVSSQTSEQLRANLYAQNSDGTYDLYDGNLTMYNVDNSNTIDGMDAIKMSNFGENFGLARENRTLVIERRKSMTSADTIFFNMWNMRLKTYKIEILTVGLAFGNRSGVLEDRFFNTKTPIDLNGTNSAEFTIINTPGSYAPDRFRIIFSMPAYKLLPLAFTSIKAHKNNNAVNIEWAVENESDILHYNVERSINGQSFIKLATIDSKAKNNSTYKWSDLSASQGNNFYRVSTTDINGKIEYSKIINVFAGINNTPLLVYPNPVVNGLINIRMANQAKGVYTTMLINSQGQVTHLEKISHDGGSFIKTIQANQDVAKGSYTLQIITPDITKVTSKILLK